MLRKNTFINYNITTNFINNLQVILYNYLYIGSCLVFLIGFILYFKNHKHFKIINNFVHLIHAVLIIIVFNNISNSNNYSIIINISTGFFIADIIKILICDNPVKQIIFICHHIIAIVSLYLISNNFEGLALFGLKIFYYLEFSNILLYINYLIIKTNKNHFVILGSTLIQFIWYSYFRLILFTSFLFENFYKLINTYNYYIFTFILLIYLLGVYWALTLLKQSYKSFYKIIKSA